MKRLLLLLCALLVVSLVSSSDLFAASKSRDLSREYRIQTIIALFWQHAFPLPGIIIVPDDTPIVIENPESRVSGDADDYANGKAIPGPQEERPDGSRTIIGPAR